MDHSQAPLLKGLAEYHELDRYGFTPPTGLLKHAEELMADAVGAEHAFFSTFGSSLSVKAAMLSVAGHSGICCSAVTRTSRWWLA